MTHPLMKAAQVQALLERCREARITVDFQREIQNGIQLLARRGSYALTINVYTGKNGVRIVLQGSGPLKSELSESAPLELPYSVWIGSDESGKGDFFGPLVVAAVRADAGVARELVAEGVRDSKVLSAGRIESLDRRVRDRCLVSVVHLEPPEYNRRYDALRNVNSLLGWAHAQVIEGILKQNPDAEAAIADQFGDESYIRRELQDLGKQVTLIQRPRAESDPAVAAASIVARAAFVRSMDAMGRSFDFEFPKGAGAEVVNAGRRFIAERGRDQLARVAKMHFKTANQL